MADVRIFDRGHVFGVPPQRVRAESVLWKLRYSAARFVDSHHAGSGIFQYTSLRPQEGYMVPTFQVFNSPPTMCLRRAGDEVPDRRICVRQRESHHFEAVFESPENEHLGLPGFGALLRSFQEIL